MKRIFIFFALFTIHFTLSTKICALDLSLETCRRMALETDEDMHIAGNRMEQSSLDRAIAKTAYLPKLDGNASAFYITPNSSVMESMELQMKGVYLAGFSLTQPIYTGGKIITANRMARLGEEATKDQYEATRMDILANAEKSYWMYVAVLSKIDMIRTFINQLDSVYSYTRSAYEVGLTVELNVKRIETKQSELQYRLQQALSGADLCRLALCRIIGVADDTPITPTEDLEHLNIDIESFLGIESRPELSLARKNIDVKRYEVDMTKADFLPTVGLQIGWNAFGNMKLKSMVQGPDGNYYPYSSTTNYNGFVGAISVSVPIFHWGEGLRKVKKARIEVENAELAFEKNRKLMELQARQAYSNYADGISLIRSAEMAFDEATRTLRIMNEQYEYGLMTLTDVLEAQSQWHSAYSALIEAKTQYRINRIDYLRSCGQL